MALLPVKNEDWILPTYLSSISKLADEIIALDDTSSDKTRQILESAGVLVLSAPKADFPNLGAKRNILLNEGRKRNGTHFICLDADEIFSSDFLPHARETIESLKPGQKLSMRWVHFWKDTTHFLNDGNHPLGSVWKDIAFCDDTALLYPEKALSEPRTPIANAHEDLLVPENKGVVLHFQFANWKRVQYKQAWYRCLEFIQGIRGARRINATYGMTLKDNGLLTAPVPTIWISSLPLPKQSYQPNSNWHKKEILKWFDIYGIEFFEPLQIWYIPELRDLFIKKVGREPKPSVAPKWLLKLNAIRNALKIKK